MHDIVWHEEKHKLAENYTFWDGKFLKKFDKFYDLGESGFLCVKSHY